MRPHAIEPMRPEGKKVTGKAPAGRTVVVVWPLPSLTSSPFASTSTGNVVGTLTDGMVSVRVILGSSAP